ncbi:heavy-metal-associated domain-containing protein [Serratia marcescens]|uniref:heavy-metal-associated domain-containing protein n=1 Tax=Serratia marcescens TaxID=615 RepID=UPI000CDB3D6C|nr:heavy-metal-associated domain-containing protein [Serratia marcescens]POP22239.1 heavy metal transport/detoxification protein [Serratia marcescens]POP26895.1 heavy metal transport/detoxification protein [Serratia marcescens]WLS90132.1 heavy-metal-associated domain-containing protein [Serratia marcescens]
MIRFHIPTMTCGGCAKSVTRTLLSVDPQVRIQTEPAKREVLIESLLHSDTFIAALDEAGFPPAEAD